MSTSSVAPPPIVVVVPSYDGRARQDGQMRNEDASAAYRPPPGPPLPPGQGTRIDQLA